MVAEAAAELDHLSGPDAVTSEAIAVRLAILHEQCNWPAVRVLASDLARRGDAKAWIWITWAYATRRAVSLAAAEAILLEAETKHPEEPTIQFNLGCYACQRGNLTVARRRVDRAIALDASFGPLAENDPDLAPLRAARSAGFPPSK